MISITLAAGQGTRLRPLTYAIPKILLPINGKVLLEYILDNIGKLAISHNYVVVSEHSDLVDTYIKKANLKNVSVLKGLGWETGGDLSIALEEINKIDDYLVLNGDIVTDISISELYKFHIKKRPYVSMALIRLNDPNEIKRFGQIELENDYNITDFKEKAESSEKDQAYVNVGFYVFDRDFIKMREDYLPTKKFKLEHELFPKLAKEGKLYGKILNPTYWWDVGTLDSYINAEINLIKYFSNKKKI
jgi:NDP-sugar pyrophosphorylase family protein